MRPMEEEARSDIVFFDLETTVPTRPGQKHAILEFGAIRVCPWKLVELESYSTLVRPSDLSLIPSLSVRSNGITRDAVSSAPSFGEIADQVYGILHGRIWAGHNILRFDCVRIREAFAEIGRPPPEPKGTIDSLALLTQKFGRRAGNMKMASLASYFELGQQSHRSLDDVRMNLEVVKHCATVLFLESSLPDLLTPNRLVSPNVNTSILGQVLGDASSSSSSSTASSSFFANRRMEENHPVYSLMTATTEDVVDPAAPTRKANPDVFNMNALGHEMQAEPDHPDTALEVENLMCQAPISDAQQPPTPEGSIGSAGYLEPEEVSISSISASLVPFFRGTRRIRLLHHGAVFQLCCRGLRVKYGVSKSKYPDYAGRPRFTFVVDVHPTVCQILDACNGIAHKLSVESGSSSMWKPIVIRKNEFSGCPNVRLQIPTINGDSPRYETEIYKKEISGAVEKLVFSQCSADELNSLISPGTFVDAYFSLDPYDYQQNAGIRVMAKKLFVHST
ncbi:hypothetical protein SAY87_021734 [Trapa incisa]|uniref:Exonuclease domain-containing protein n=1 Tax=Trapa incisa TaxID=236973 RepID=A0AAN7JSE6_9MYRT|nr:hypothetical protein SAY87_021734 [Trapa incisa]